MSTSILAIGALHQRQSRALTNDATSSQKGSTRWEHLYYKYIWSMFNSTCHHHEMFGGKCPVESSQPNV